MAEIGPGATARAARFAARLRGERLPDFEAFLRGADWRGADARAHRDLAAIASLLAARPAIDAEVNGEVLARLAAAVGEDLFDSICEADMAWFESHSSPRIPDLHDLAAHGEGVLARAATSADCARLAQMAADIMQRQGAVA